MSTDDGVLRVALLTYRGNPRCGGQGVYVRHLSRALVDLGHHVEVLSGPPYPELDERVRLQRVPGLDLYRQPDPFRRPHLAELTHWTHVAELGLTWTAGFPEPLVFSLRAHRALARRGHDVDVVHDNQCLGTGLLGIQASPPRGLGLPLLATIHHPVTVDRRVELAHAGDWRRRLALRRFYGFTRMQTRVARRLARILTVSHSSLDDIVTEHGVRRERLRVVPVGVDARRWRPLASRPRVSGRLMTTASADVSMKGLAHLLEALPKVHTERPDAELVVVGAPRPGSPLPAVLERLALGAAVRFVSGVSDEELVELYAEAEVAVVPSLYEGFSLPAVEAMACGVPLVATTGGALPEVVGHDGRAAVLVPPGDAGALAGAILALLGDPARRASLGAAGRARALARYSWRATAEATAAQYREVIALARAQAGTSARC
ncbi:MAG: glycosyltransferase family 4 protein [Actinomycetota bacterium]|nr:glycosyltransferase family 4 protein [Actinomycetota bacterium]